MYTLCACCLKSLYQRYQKCSVTQKSEDTLKSGSCYQILWKWIGMSVCVCLEQRDRKVIEVTPGCFSKTYISVEGQRSWKACEQFEGLLHSENICSLLCQGKSGEIHTTEENGPIRKSAALDSGQSNRIVERCWSKVGMCWLHRGLVSSGCFLPSLYLTFLPTEAGYRILTSVF